MSKERRRSRQLLELCKEYPAYFGYQYSISHMQTQNRKEDEDAQDSYGTQYVSKTKARKIKAGRSLLRTNEETRQSEEGTGGRLS